MSKNKLAQPIAEKPITTQDISAIIPTTLIESESAIWKKIFYILLPIMAIAMMLASFNYGLSGDEAYANGMGKAAMKFITSFGADRSIFNLPDNINRDGVLTYYGNIFDLIAIMLTKISPFDEYTTRHIFNAFVGFLGIFFSGFIVKDYWGFKPAVFCILIMVFYPFYFGHAMNNPKDVPMASFYIMGIYYLLVLFRNYNSLRWYHYIGAIGAIILTIDVRIAGLLLITYMAPLTLMHWNTMQQKIKSSGFIKAVLPLVIVALASYFGASLFWPYAMQSPIENPLNALSFLSDFKVELGQIWEGEKIPSGDMPGNYLLRCIAMTSPYVFIIGLLLMAVTLLIKYKSLPANKVILFLIFTGLFPLFYIMYKGSNVYHLWRHVLFVFPSLAILASVGWAYIDSVLGNKKTALFTTVLFFMFLLEPMIFTAKTFPNNVNYFNGLAGGTQGAYGQYEMDFYYNSMKPCVDYLEQKIIPNEKDTILVVSNAYHLMVQYFGDKYPKVKLNYARFQEKNMKEWDYAIFHISLIPLQEIQQGTWTNYNNPVYINKVYDKPLCVLLKRPSKEDLRMFSLLEKNDIGGAFEACNNYLAKDPNNPTILELKGKIMNSMRQQVIPTK